MKKRTKIIISITIIIILVAFFFPKPSNGTYQRNQLVGTDTGKECKCLGIKGPKKIDAFRGCASQQSCFGIPFNCIKTVSLECKWDDFIITPESFS